LTPSAEPTWLDPSAEPTWLDPSAERARIDVESLPERHVDELE
jgi:hypothetical protein